MIRDVVLHIQGELPMKADIEALPTAADAGLLCTNLRTLEGRKPLSTEFLDSVFLMPYHVIRFIEIPRESIEKAGLGADMPSGPAMIPAGSTDGAETRAAAGGDPGEGPRVIVTPPPAISAEESAADDEDEGLEDLEPDAELLRRIREA